MLLRNWGKIRKRGVVHFILVYGVLGWGVLIGGLLGYVFIELFESGMSSFEWRELIIRGVSFGFLGALVGLMGWHSKESQYEEQNDEHSHLK